MNCPSDIVIIVVIGVACGRPSWSDKVAKNSLVEFATILEKVQDWIQ